MKLTQQQRAVLTSACEHELGFATRPSGLTAAQIARIASGLNVKGLTKEFRAKQGAPTWREDEEGRCYALKILKAGREAIADGVVESASQGPGDGADAIGKTRHGSQRASKPVDRAKPGPELADEAASEPRVGSKQAMVVDMLRKEQGVTIEALVSATGWLPHSARAALTGLRKKGFAIARDRRDGSSPTYRITEEPSKAAA